MNFLFRIETKLNYIKIRKIKKPKINLILQKKQGKINGLKYKIFCTFAPASTTAPLIDFNLN
jgi:hypothetical protein